MLHFSTLFNSKFLPQGLALYFSLKKFCDEFQLYILCVDQEVYEQLQKLNLDNVNLINLSDVETDQLKEVKKSRTIAEYCWTLTPQIFSFVKEAFPKIDHLTYLDADLFFFDDPQLLLNDFFSSSASVQITDHHYAPEYEFYSELSGKFCVQFLTFKFDSTHNEILKRWQDQCMDWCYARVEDGKYGDQKYLDDWPTSYPDQVFICSHDSKMLAPWNIKHFSSKEKRVSPVFYHFHNFRFISSTKVLCFRAYKIGQKNLWVYMRYRRELVNAIVLMKSHNLSVPSFPLAKEKFGFLKNIVRRYLKRNILFMKLDSGDKYVD